MQSKLTAAEVAAMRKLWATGNWTQASLGRAFGVNPGQVSRVVNGKSWASMPGEMTIFERIAANARA